MILVVNTHEDFDLHEIFKLVHKYLSTSSNPTLVKIGERARAIVQPSTCEFMVVDNITTGERTAVSLLQFIRAVFDIPDSVEISYGTSSIARDRIDDPVYDIRSLSTDYHAWLREVSARSNDLVREVAFLHEVNDYSYRNDDMGWEYCIEQRTVPDFGGCPPNIVEPRRDWLLVTTNDPRG